MSELDPSRLEQAVKRDRVRQLRDGLRLKDQVTQLVESHGGHYDIEVGVREEDEMPVIEHVDRKVVKAIGGGLEGVYRELVSSGEKVAAEAVVFDYEKEKKSTQ